MANLYAAEDDGAEEHPGHHGEDAAADHVDQVVVEREDRVVMVHKEAHPHKHDDVGCNKAKRDVRMALRTRKMAHMRAVCGIMLACTESAHMFTNQVKQGP